MAKRDLKLPRPRKTPHPGEHPPQKPRHKHEHDDCHDDEIKTILQLERLIMALAQTVTDALQAQDTKLANLAAKVDAFIAGGGNTSADNQAIVDHLNAQGVTVDQISAKLTTP